MKHRMWMNLLALCGLLLALAGSVGAQEPVGTVFAYQGCLMDVDNKPLSGKYDLRFELYDAENGGNLVGGPIELPEIEIKECEFAVQLDFGSGAFAGEARYLEVVARKSGKSDPYAVFPRQAILARPYALYALSPEISS